MNVGFEQDLFLHVCVDGVREESKSKVGFQGHEDSPENVSRVRERIRLVVLGDVLIQVDV